MNLASLVSPSSDHLDGAPAREAVRADAHARALKEALPPWHAGYDYYNFVETTPEAEVVT
jgi:hypothetical protein